MSQPAKTCCHCGVSGDVEALRPYGPNQAPICHHCAKATPARVAETKANMHRSMEAALKTGNGVATIVPSIGFVPGVAGPWVLRRSIPI